MTILPESTAASCCSSTLYDLGQHALELSKEGTLLLAGHPAAAGGNNDPLKEVVHLESDETYKLFVALHALFSGSAVVSKRE